MRVVPGCAAPIGGRGPRPARQRRHDHPPGQRFAPEELADPEFRMWRWLQSPPAGLPVCVGYGSVDRFAAGMQRIAERFPPAARHAIPGGHEWPVWQQLWEHFLDLGHFSA